MLIVGSSLELKLLLVFNIFDQLISFLNNVHKDYNLVSAFLEVVLEGSNLVGGHLFEGVELILRLFFDLGDC